VWTRSCVPTRTSIQAAASACTRMCRTCGLCGPSCLSHGSTHTQVSPLYFSRPSLKVALIRREAVQSLQSRRHSFMPCNVSEPGMALLFRMKKRSEQCTSRLTVQAPPYKMAHKRSHSFHRLVVSQVVHAHPNLALLVARCQQSAAAAAVCMLKAMSVFFGVVCRC